MSNKTPFELRAELLTMARDHLQQQYEINLAFSRELWQKTLEAFTISKQMSVEELVKFNQDTLERLETILPKAPTFEEITKRATELYTFVQKKE